MAYLIAAWVFLLAALVLTYRRHLAACWREPVLRMPVLILESDDWGAGPLEQAAALRRLAQILASVRDAAGRPATMTLGVVPAAIDRNVWRASQKYARRHLGADEYAEVLGAMREGITAGVFAPQLHGMEHYWPAALLRRSAADPAVREWMADERAATESLPDTLQSRWIDASSLPSHSLPPTEIQQAVEEETRLFRLLFGETARVAVPNTFVWYDDVERAWAAQGVRHVVTPGTRYEARDANGCLVPSGRRISNGECASSGVCYLVRDVYFEPARGHRPETLARGLVERIRLGRPCLVETHRFNYLGNDAEHSFTALREALEQAIRVAPGVRFVSTAELGDAIVERDSVVVEQRLPARFAVWVERSLALSRFRKLAWLSGLALLMHGGRTLTDLLATRGATST